ncbi:hypothetical protein C0992_011273 [Termitomyces sp. T32_za158]|nr:hypothetical protein C0992_011273 [Termitomyces sp. T32_za158]
MLALCRVRVPSTALWRRANSTLQSTTPAADTTPPPPASVTTKPAKPRPSPAPAPASVTVESTDANDSKTKGRRRKRTPIPPKRPDISLANPRKWNRPIGPGVIPAYDLALELIYRDSKVITHQAAALREEVKVLEAKVAELGGWGSEGAQDVEAEMEKKREKLKILEVQSRVNLPYVRWKVANAMGWALIANAADMTDPAHRHLVEQKWRNDGDLDLLMERLHQMHVIPDVLPDLRPTIDVHVVANTTYRERLDSKKLHTTTRASSDLLFSPASRVTRNKLDVPDEENQSFRTYLHWLKPNVPLSATTQKRIRLRGHTPYIPPHPQQGTPYHRYVLLLLPQPPLGNATYTLNSEARAEPGVPTSQTLDIPPVEYAERANFDVRAFVQQWGLDVVPGGGAHMWREVWNKKVSNIYRNVLKEPEPRFGRLPKEDPYVEYKLKKRYI